MHRSTYRILCIIAAILCPAFGVIYRLTDPTAIDPLWVRFTMATGAVSLWALSYTSTWIRKHLVAAVHGLFYALTIWFIFLTTINAFSPNYSLGLLFSMTAIGVAFSLSLEGSTFSLLKYLLFTVLTTIPLVYWVPTREISAAVFSTSILSTALVIYVVARSKMRAEQAVKASEQRYHTLMSAANDAIFIADPDTGALVDANQKAQQLSGRSLEELRHMHLADLFPADKRKHYKAIFEKHVFEEMPISEDMYVINQEGGHIPVDISASIIDVGEEHLIQGIFRDITDSIRFQAEREARRRAEELLRLKTSFLNNMSHELRTPLASILGYAEVLTEEVQEGQHFAQTITLSARRLQKTLDSILDLARLESGQTTLSPTHIDVVSEVRKTVALLQPLANQKALDLHVMSDVSAVHARLDPTCLNRIVNNLVGNAIKFTEEGGVTVEVNGNDSVVYLHIKDTGIGISDEFLEHLFDEFRQESTGLARSHEGTGLGLAITKRLVDLMGGSIDVESEKGVGTTFTVIFPRTVGPSEDTPPPADDHVDVDPSPGTTVLIVEDHPNMCSLLERTLGTYYRTLSAQTPDAAIETASDMPLDLLVLDINLGADKDGVELLHQLRSLPAHEEVPAIALTAYAMPEDRDQFLSLGFNSYLSKPFTRQQLLKTVEQTLLASAHTSPAEKNIISP